MNKDCIYCRSKFQKRVLSLGGRPLMHTFPKGVDDAAGERFPLALYLCEDCKLAHVPIITKVQEELRRHPPVPFASPGRIERARDFAGEAAGRFGLNRTNSVLEIASGDGAFLRPFLQRNIRCVGVEADPASAAEGRKHGVDTRAGVWSRALAEELADDGIAPDLIIADGVLANHDDVNGFLDSVRYLLRPSGVLTMELPHLHAIVENRAFDALRHGRYSYFSLFMLQKILARNELVVFDVERPPAPGDTLRIYACHAKDIDKPMSSSVGAFMMAEEAAGMMSAEYFKNFSKEIRSARAAIRRFFARAAKEGKRVAGYGAPSTAAMLLDYCDITPAEMPYIVDSNRRKHGLYLPGVHVPIRPVAHIDEDKPDYLFILPWKLSDGIVEKMAHIREWGGRFAVPLPKMEVID